MKMRTGFVSNSSSTAYYVVNKSTEKKTLVDFVRENPQLIELWNDEHSGPSSNYTVDDLVKVAEKIPEEWGPKEGKTINFGDNDGDWGGTPLGEVYDYMMRGGGHSNSFSWDGGEQCR